MHALRIAAFISLATLMSPGPSSSPVALAIDAERSIAQFTVTKLGFADVTGRFTEMEGQIHWTPAAPGTASIRWRVAVASVVTEPGATNRDRTLQAPEYFDAARHPWMTFDSTRVRETAPDTLEVDGRITIRGTTRPLTVTVRHSGTAAAPVFETAFELDRYDFGIAGGRVMSRLIGRTAYIYLKAVTKEPTT